MKVLSRFVGGPGHLLPQVPLLRALLAAGAEVAVHGSARAIGVVADLGMELLVRPEPPAPSSSGIRPLVPVDEEAERRVVADHFAGPMAREGAETVLGIVEQVRPDILVCDDVDFGAMLAAERAGLPLVVVQVIASGALVLPALVRPALEKRRRELGLPPDAELRMLRGALMVAPFPALLRDPQAALPRADLLLRPDADPRPAVGPGVYATLGTEFPRESGDLLHRIAAALSVLDRPALLTVGRDLDPAAFPVAPNVRVERFVPQRDALRDRGVMVHHGGSGAMIGAIAAGLPQVVLPMGADQPFNARRIVDLGLGLALDALSASPAEIAEAVQEAQHDEGIASAVRAARDELLAMPDPSVAADAVLALA